MKTQVQFKEKCELLNGNISEERIYVTFWNNYPQSTTGKRDDLLLLTAVIDHWHFLTSMCWFHALDLSLVRPTPPTGETTERICQSVYIVPKLQWFNLANLFISFSNWLFETGLKRCYGSVIIIITIVYNTENGKVRPPLHTLWWHEDIRHISEAGLLNLCQ